MRHTAETHTSVIPAQAGTRPTLGSGARHLLGQVPAFAGMTVGLGLAMVLMTASPAFASEGVGGDVDPLIYRLAVFAMAIFVGYYVVWSVTPALHTPLMSVTNAISSVIVVGALLAVGVPLIASGSILAKFFGVLAVALASVNIFGGFLVTQRMLAMYKKKEK
jgi:H+-translocating NAD(P) transhydrogenase subunit alpha